MAIFKGRHNPIINRDSAMDANRKFRHYIHPELKMTSGEVNLVLEKSGKTHISNTTGHNIECSAGLVNLLSRLSETLDRQALELTLTADKVVFKQEMEDGTWDTVECPMDLIKQVSRTIMATREVVFKDEPFKGEEEE